MTEEDIRHKELTGGRLEKLHKLKEEEILFEAANTVRLGKDLLYLVSSSGNMKGAKWLQSVLGNEYKVHVTDSLYRASHLDSTVLCLRPGLVLLNSKRANPKNLPDIFSNWDKIWFDDVAPTTESELKFQSEIRDQIAKELSDLGFKTNLGYMSSPWVGMNLLSLDQNTVLVDERQAKMISLLESYKLNVITVNLRHMYTQGEGYIVQHLIPYEIVNLKAISKDKTYRKPKNGPFGVMFHHFHLKNNQKFGQGSINKNEFEKIIIFLKKKIMKF